MELTIEERILLSYYDQLSDEAKEEVMEFVKELYRKENEE